MTDSTSYVCLTSVYVDGHMYSPDEVVKLDQETAGRLGASVAQVAQVEAPELAELAEPKQRQERKRKASEAADEQPAEAL